MTPIIIGGRRIGADEKCLLIAEISANHDRDLDQALALVDVAAVAGWDCVKFQTYDADSLTVPSQHPSMRIDPVWGSDNLHDLYRSAGMPMEFHRPLFQRVRERGLLPFTSVYDPKDLEFTEDLGCEVYKIASFEMTFDDLLIAVAGTGKPVIMSTGLADLVEIDHAMGILRRSGSGPVILLHCCSAYPTPVHEANLRAMATLSRRFDVPVGYSDHTIGITVPVAAAAMGAVALEKHFTNDTRREGPDHRFSATPEQMAEIARRVGEVHQACGSGTKETRPAERGNKAVGRRSAFALRDLPAGHVLTPEDFRFVRPAAGVPANEGYRLIGIALSRAVSRYDPITDGDLPA